MHTFAEIAVGLALWLSVLELLVRRQPSATAVALPELEREALRLLCSGVGAKFLGVFGAPGFADRLLFMPTTGPLADCILEITFHEETDELDLLRAIRDAADKKRFSQGSNRARVSTIKIRARL